MLPDRHLLFLFLALNLALAGACASFVLSSTSPAVLPGPVVPPPAPPAPPPPRSVSTPQSQPPADPSTVRFDWRHVWSPAYSNYLQRLRVVGCPAQTVASIAIHDVDEFYARERLKASIAYDNEYWRAEPKEQVLLDLQTLGQAHVQQRDDLLKRLLGPQHAPQWRSRVRYWETVPLTGAVLGSLSPELHRAVQEICRRACDAAETNPNPIRIAQLRQQMRLELASVLTPQQLEEFLLRYSLSSQNLRVELGPFAPTSEEFRSLFKVLDPLDQRLKLEYGELSRLSPVQRQKHHALRQQAVRSVLAQERFAAFLQATRCETH